MRIVIALVVWLCAGVFSVQAQENSDCLGCHADEGLEGVRKGKTILMHVDEKVFSGTPHEGVSCISCHADLADIEFPHAEDVERAQCGMCHDVVAEKHAGSLHGRAIDRGDPLAPNCSDCHGTHRILPHTDNASPVAVLNIPFTCTKCHREGSPVQRFRNIHQENILEHFSESIHGEGLLRKGLIVAPNCASCHTAHDILPHTDPASSISRSNIAKTCTKCHAQIELVHRKVIKGELWEKQEHVLPACVDCHQPHEIRKVFYTQGMADKDCLRCHEREGIKTSDDGHSLFVDQEVLAASGHQKISCSQCHAGVNASKRRACETITRKVDCASCHAEVGQDYMSSIHGELTTKGDQNAPTCKECHGTHGVLRKADPASPTFATNVPAMCAKCHREGESAAVRYTGTEVDIIDHYQESIHGKGLIKSGLTVTAMCTNCHTAHSERPSKDSTSSVNRANIPATCGKCHYGIKEQFARSIHGRIDPDDGKKKPVCSDCHSAHTITRADEQGFKLTIMNQCGKCHESITETYFDTYHGKVSQLGYTQTAKCYDCHGAHDIQPATDPRSHLSRENVVETCRKCHEGANRQFAGYLTHATHHDSEKYPYLYYTFWGMTSLLIGTFVFGGIHTLLWLPRALQMRRERRKREQARQKRRKADV